MCYRPLIEQQTNIFFSLNNDRQKNVSFSQVMTSRWSDNGREKIENTEKNVYTRLSTLELFWKLPVCVSRTFLFIFFLLLCG